MLLGNTQKTDKHNGKQNQDGGQFHVKSLLFLAIYWPLPLVFNIFNAFDAAQSNIYMRFSLCWYCLYPIFNKIKIYLCLCKHQTWMMLKINVRINFDGWKVDVGKGLFANLGQARYLCGALLHVIFENIFYGGQTTTQTKVNNDPTSLR